MTITDTRTREEYIVVYVNDPDTFRFHGSVWEAQGDDEEGALVTFAGDAGWMSGILDAVIEEGMVAVELETWQVRRVERLVCDMNTDFRARLFIDTTQGAESAYCAHCRDSIFAGAPVSICEVSTGVWGFAQMRKVHTDTCKQPYLSRSVGDPRTTTPDVERRGTA